MRRLYFVQDYEPYFYPRGSLYSLAEDTYRFGFRCIALGDMVANVIKSETQVPSDRVPFACDTDVYGLEGSQDRAGVVFFSRPSVPRRGFVTGVLALQEFHRRHPEQLIHLYGDTRNLEVPFPCQRHGQLPPSALNHLYNSTITGLALSFTNITLVATEMLAAGNVPVVNDNEFARAVLTSPEVVWSDPTTGSLASALSETVEHGDIAGRAHRASLQIRDNWAVTQARVVDIIEDELR